MLRALYIKETQSERPPIADPTRDRLLLILLTDLFSMNPVLQTEKARYRIIGELQAMYPAMFQTFIDQHIAKLKIQR